MSKTMDELLDELMKDKSPEELVGKDGFINQFKAKVFERMMQAEMDSHLGYKKGQKKPKGQKNSRNGTSEKTVQSDSGPLQIQVPRDRAGDFEPKIIPKHQRRISGFNDKVVQLYARGMTFGEIKGFLKEEYGVDVSKDLLSRATEHIHEEVSEFQNRQLDSLYPIVYLDALVLKVRYQGRIQKRSVYLALGVNMEGKKDVLGLWMDATEGAKFWLNVVTQLKNRGVEDILICCTDGLSGFSEAIEAVFPKTIVQTCVVHLIRQSLRHVSYKDSRPVAKELKSIYRAVDEESAQSALQRVEEEWGSKYPLMVNTWKRAWSRFVPFLDFSEDIRRAIYTTNAIESLNRQLRKVLKTRGHFPNDDAAKKLIYLGLMNAQKKWKMPIKEWGKALNQFAIHFEGRIKSE